MPSKEQLARQYRDKGLVMLGVNLKEPAAAVRQFRQEFQASFPLLVDPEGTVAERYGVRAHPVTFLIDRQGRLVGQVVGERDWTRPEARELVERLLAGRW